MLNCITQCFPPTAERPAPAEANALTPHAPDRIRDCLEIVAHDSSQIFKAVFDLISSCGAQLEEKIGQKNTALGLAATAATIIGQSKTVFFALVSVGLLPGHAALLLSLLQLSALAIGVYLLFNWLVQKAVRPLNERLDRMEDRMDRDRGGFNKRFDDFQESVNASIHGLREEIRASSTLQSLTTANYEQLTAIIQSTVRSAIQEENIRRDFGSQRFNTNTDYQITVEEQADRDEMPLQSNESRASNMTTDTSNQADHLFPDDYLAPFQEQINGRCTELQQQMRAIQDQITQLEMDATKSFQNDEAIRNLGVELNRHKNASKDKNSEIDRRLDIICEVNDGLEQNWKNLDQSVKKLQASASQYAEINTATIENSKDLAQLQKNFQRMESDLSTIQSMQAQFSELANQIDFIDNWKQSADVNLNVLIQNKEEWNKKMRADLTKSQEICESFVKASQKELGERLAELLAGLGLPSNEAMFNAAVEQNFAGIIQRYSPEIAA